MEHKVLKIITKAVIIKDKKKIKIILDINNILFKHLPLDNYHSLTQ